jgi:hypothetical protein
MQDSRTVCLICLACCNIDTLHEFLCYSTKHHLSQRMTTLPHTLCVVTARQSLRSVRLNLRAGSDLADYHPHNQNLQ